MTYKTTLARLAIMLIALLAFSGCVNFRAAEEHDLTIERKEVSLDNLKLQHHAKCKEQARKKRVEIWTLDGCQRFGNPQYNRSYPEEGRRR